MLRGRVRQPCADVAVDRPAGCGYGWARLRAARRAAPVGQGFNLNASNWFTCNRSKLTLMRACLLRRPLVGDVRARRNCGVPAARFASAVGCNSDLEDAVLERPRHLRSSALWQPHGPVEAAVRRFRGMQVFARRGTYAPTLPGDLHTIVRDRYRNVSGLTPGRSMWIMSQPSSSNTSSSGTQGHSPKLWRSVSTGDVRPSTGALSMSRTTFRITSRGANRGCCFPASIAHLRCPQSNGRIAGGGARGDQFAGHCRGESRVSGENPLLHRALAFCPGSRLTPARARETVV